MIQINTEMVESERTRITREDIGQLKTFRNAVGINQTDLAEELSNIHPRYRRAYLSSFENGSLGPPLDARDFQEEYLLSVRKILARRLAQADQKLEDHRTNK